MCGAHDPIFHTNYISFLPTLLHPIILLPACRPLSEARPPCTSNITLAVHSKSSVVSGTLRLFPEAGVIPYLPLFCLPRVIARLSRPQSIPHLGLGPCPCSPFSCSVSINKIFKILFSKVCIHLNCDYSFSGVLNNPQIKMYQDGVFPTFLAGLPELLVC